MTGQPRRVKPARSVSNLLIYIYKIAAARNCRGAKTKPPRPGEDGAVGESVEHGGGGSCPHPTPPPYRGREIASGLGGFVVFAAAGAGAIHHVVGVEAGIAADGAFDLLGDLRVLAEEKL